MPKKKKVSITEETPLLPAYFSYDPAPSENKKPKNKNLKGVLKKLAVKSEKKEKKPLKDKVGNKAEVEKPVEEVQAEPIEKKVEPVVTVEPVKEIQVSESKSELISNPVENTLSVTPTSTTDSSVISKIASTAASITESKVDPTPPEVHVLQDNPMGTEPSSNTLSHSDYGAPFINNTVIGATDQSTQNPLDTVIIQDEVVNDSTWKRYLRIGLVIFLILFMIFDLIVAYLLFKNRKVVAPVAGATYSVVPTGITAQSTQKEVIAFLPSWMMSKNIPVNTHNLTQLIYFGLPASESGELIKNDKDGNFTMEWNYLNSEQFKKIQEESKYSKTKILLAVTSFDNVSIDKLVSNPTATKRLTTEIIKVMKDLKLDGVNINFEYITDSDFPTVIHMNKFLETVTTEIKKENPQAIVSFDVNALAVEIDGAYDMVKIGEIVDQVILMGYDYHRAPSTVAGPVAPINGTNEHSISKSLQSMVGRVPSEKIILGLPFYGYEWQTVSNKHRSVTVPNTGAVASYGRVKELLKNRPDIKVQWDENSQSPWLYYDQSGFIKQIYYEDERSLGEKLELVDERDMQGIAIWSLGYEGSTTELWDVINQWRK